MKKKKFNIIVAGYIVVGIILCALVGNALAKYFQTSSNPSTFKAMDFYFTSDLLDEGTHVLSSGVDSVSFSLWNYADALRVSEVEVDVTEVQISGPGNPVITFNDAQRTLGASLPKELSVTVSGLVPGNTYVIEATATGGRVNGVGGYVQTISGTIIVPELENALYTYFQSQGSYVLLTVWSEGYSGNVTIDIPDGVIPDYTDSVIRTAVTGGEFEDNKFEDNKTFKDKAYASHTYRFFVTGESVTVDSFTVKYDNGKTAGYKVP